MPPKDKQRKKNAAGGSARGGRPNNQNQDYLDPTFFPPFPSAPPPGYNVPHFHPANQHPMAFFNDPYTGDVFMPSLEHPTMFGVPRPPPHHFGPLPPLAIPRPPPMMHHPPPHPHSPQPFSPVLHPLPPSPPPFPYGHHQMPPPPPPPPEHHHRLEQPTSEPKPSSTTVPDNLPDNPFYEAESKEATATDMPVANDKKQQAAKNQQSKPKAASQPPPPKRASEPVPAGQEFVALNAQIARLFPKLPLDSKDIVVRYLISTALPPSTCGDKSDAEIAALCKDALKDLKSRFLNGGKLPVFPAASMYSGEGKQPLILKEINADNVMSALCELLSTPHATESSISDDHQSITGIYLDPSRSVSPHDAICTAPPLPLREFLTSAAAKKLVVQALKSLDVSCLLLSPGAVVSLPIPHNPTHSQLQGINNLLLTEDLDFGAHRAIALDAKEVESIAGEIKYGSASVLDLLHLSNRGGGNGGQTEVEEQLKTVAPSITEQHLELKLRNALHFKQFTFKNNTHIRTAASHHDAPAVSDGGDAVWLLGGVATPQLPQTFAALDTARLFWSEGHAAVYLAPGQQHKVTVAFSCADSPSRSSETGILQQVFVFLIAVKADTLAYQQLAAVSGIPVTDVVVPSAAKGSVPQNYRVFAVARRVSASVMMASKSDLMNSCLDAEAKPFISKALQALLDSEPESVEAAVEGKSKRWDMLRLPNTTEMLTRKVPRWLPDDNELHPTLKAKYTTYMRLLDLEQHAMDQDIRRHDMFYTRLRFAVFKAAKGVPVVRYTLAGGGTNQENPETLFYRGPDVTALQPDGVYENKEEGWNMFVLGYLDVPGLPEGRPALIIGDQVHLRAPDRPGHRVDTIVASVIGSNVFLLLPSSFFTPSLVQSLLLGKAGASLDGLVHVRFGYDKRPMQQMRAVLHMTATNKVNNMSSTNSAGGKKKHQASFFLPSLLGSHIGGGGDATAVDERCKLQPKRATVSSTVKEMKELGRQKLNDEQKHAVAAVLCGAGRASPYALFGPPGTGKTVTLVECALQILNSYPAARLLLAAPQAYSADLLCSALAANRITTEQMLRVNDPRRPPFTAKEDTLPYSIYNEETRTFSLPPFKRLQQARVVVSTCSGAGLLYNWPAAGHPTRAITFTHVLIDEAGQALLPEAIIPLCLLEPPRGLTLTKPPTNGTSEQPDDDVDGDPGWGAMLCGDPKQLGPVVRSPQAAAAGLATSLLEALINVHTKTAVDFMKKSCVAATNMLVRNYRSHKQLLALPSKMFYDNHLKAAADPSSVLPPAWEELYDEEKTTAGLQEAAEVAVDGKINSISSNSKEISSDDKQKSSSSKPSQLRASLLCYGVRGQQLREADVPSYFNPMEASTVIELVQGLLNSGAGVVPEDIGVMATYRKQVQKIRLLLRQVGLGSIRVGTLDDYQGQEERIIFISTVLSKPESLPKMTTASTNSSPAAGNTDSSSHLSIWGNPKRFNVAVTRAKALLVIVGHPSVLGLDPCWRELLRYAVTQGVYRGAGASAMRERYHLDTTTSLNADDNGEEASWDELEDADKGQHNGEERGEHSLEMQSAIDQLAELALLGAGDVDRLWPETLDEMHDAYAEEMPFRVML